MITRNPPYRNANALASILIFLPLGARVARDFLRQDLVDRLVIFQSPVAIGGDALSPFDGLPHFQEALSRKPIVRRVEFGEDVMTAYALREG